MPTLIVSQFEFEVWLGKPLAVATIVLAALIARWLLHRVVDQIVKRAETGVLPERIGRVEVARAPVLEHFTDPDAASRRRQRAQAIGGLLKSIISGLVVAVAITMVLSALSIDVAPILASAGIVGIALGFGAQSLVKDFLAGMSMIVEDQYGVGDHVDLGHACGTVEAVTLRVTRLRDPNGTVWYVRNGEVLRVGNQSQNWARLFVDVEVAHGEDLVRVRQVLDEVMESLWQDKDFSGLLIAVPEVMGVEAMSGDSFVLRVAVKTAPLEQSVVARAIRERIVLRFEHDNIQLASAQS